MPKTDYEKQKKNNKKGKTYKDIYISVNFKYILGHMLALVWMLSSIYLSIPWVNDLSYLVPKGIAIAIIAGIGYIPGYINAFNLASLLLDRQPKFKTINPKDPITILIACWNEEENIGEVLEYIKNQDYEGKIKVIVIDNASTDKTFERAKQASEVCEISYGYKLNNALYRYNIYILLDTRIDTCLLRKVLDCRSYDSICFTSWNFAKFYFI